MGDTGYSKKGLKDDFWRFFKYVSKDSCEELFKYSSKYCNCWNWTGGKFSSGYGRFWFSGKNIYSHRFSYEFFKGEIPFDFLVCHKCDNKLCVNPKHLFLGSYKDNSDDSVKKGRNAFGERSGRAKLTESEVSLIRDIYSKGERSYYEIGNEFNVTGENIRSIVERRTWKNVK